MKIHLVPLACALGLDIATPQTQAHLIGDEAHDGQPAHYDFTVRPSSRIIVRSPEAARQIVLLASANVRQPALAAAGAPASGIGTTLFAAKVFAAFAPKVRTRVDDNFLYVESDGLPAHNLMVGITAWQQQVPLPQPYTGNNAWRIPLHPVPAKNPLSIKGRFLRGAIALAANGIPIFNPQNNRGEVSQEIGELDQWGGHCGRADDYHYHATPFHLQNVLGKALPVAYALDGYPIYGLTEPDGSATTKLDEFNGHETAAAGYHYHGSEKYPYVNGGFHGEVAEAGGQVDPQPRAQNLRPAGEPLRGARITGFTAKENKSFSLKYEIRGAVNYINYAINDNGSVKFDFVSANGQTDTQTYTPGQRGGGDRPPGEGKGKDGQKKGKGKGGDRAEGGPTIPPPLILTPKHSGKFVLHSSVVAEGGALPAEFTGDGDGVTPPLDWSGAPEGTKSFALVMDHLAPGNEMKCYWTMWDIPATTMALPKNVQGVGKVGPGFKGALGYEPPHSQGPGKKTYTLHVYALSTPVQLDKPQREVTREVLLNAIKDSILDSADLNVTYTRPGAGGSEGAGPGGKKGDRK